MVSKGNNKTQYCKECAREIKKEQTREIARESMRRLRRERVKKIENPYRPSKEAIL